MNKDKEIANRLDSLASCIAQGSVSAAKLRDSISDIRYTIAKLRTSVENNLGAYANYDKCIPCVFMSFHGCTHPYRDEIGDVNGCVYFVDAQKERDNE